MSKRQSNINKISQKRFERSVHWNEYKTKSENKNTNFVRVNRLFALVHSNEDADFKRFKAKSYYIPKGIIKNYNVIINGKNFYYQVIDSDIKRHEEVRNLTTEQGEGYTTGCLLDYDYIKNYYRFIAVDLSKQKELDVDPEAIQQI